MRQKFKAVTFGAGEMPLHFLRQITLIALEGEF
jgi:hypothetical protein